MSAPAAAPQAAPAPSPPQRRATVLRTRLRRWGPWVALLLAATVLASLLSGSTSGELLGPDNPGPSGAQALARVLDDHGVDVRVVDGTTALLDEPVGPGTTVLLPHTAYLGPEAGETLMRHVRDADRLVVLVPDVSTAPGPTLGLEVVTSPGDGRTLEPDCTDPLVRPGDRVVTWDVQLRASGSDRSTVTACYPPTVGHGAGGAREGALLTFPATAERPTTTLVGFSSALTNDAVADEAHAALGLRLLGGSPTLLWVVPQPADAGLEAAPAGLWDVLPRNLTAVVVVLGAAVLALALVQGRRLGAVVVEPLPAVVSAAEATRSRGRLYRQARDRSHALAALQDGARSRLAPRLGLPAGASVDELVAALTTASGRPARDVRRLLTDPTAPDDPTFVTTARELRSLEEGLHV